MMLLIMKLGGLSRFQGTHTNTNFMFNVDRSPIRFDASERRITWICACFPQQSKQPTKSFTKHSPDMDQFNSYTAETTSIFFNRRLNFDILSNSHGLETFRSLSSLIMGVLW
jgi:hypothetical protein